jgi:hypothetical protein
MGLPIHGSQNMNHIRLIYNKFNYVKSRYEFLLSLLRHSRVSCRGLMRKRQKFKHKQSHSRNFNAHKTAAVSLSLPLKSSSSFSHSLTHKQKLKKAFPILSNMPFIHLNSSLIFVNTSPFALTDRRFGILHHHSPSMSYY